MFYWEVTGYGAHKHLCEDILCWFYTSFYPRHTIDITVNHRGMKREHVYGWCDIASEDTYRPRKFLIELQSNMPKRLYAETLVHELIHVKQWIDGDMKYRRGVRYYKGIEAPQFDDAPHELEAYEGEREYLLKFLCDSGRVWSGL